MSFLNKALQKITHRLKYGRYYTAYDIVCMLTDSNNYSFDLGLRLLQKQHRNASWIAGRCLGTYEIKKILTGRTDEEVLQILLDLPNLTLKLEVLMVLDPIGVSHVYSVRGRCNLATVLVEGITVTFRFFDARSASAVSSNEEYGLLYDYLRKRSKGNGSAFEDQDVVAKRVLENRFFYLRGSALYISPTVDEFRMGVKGDPLIVVNREGGTATRIMSANRIDVEDLSGLFFDMDGKLTLKASCAGYRLTIVKTKRDKLSLSFEEK